MTYTLELGQNDTDTLNAVLYEDGVAVNLTGKTVVLNLSNELGTEVNVACGLGAVINGETVAYASGGVNAVISSTLTATPCTYRGKFLLTSFGAQLSFPNDNNYISIKVWSKK